MGMLVMFFVGMMAGRLQTGALHGRPARVRSSILPRGKSRNGAYGQQQ